MPVVSQQPQQQTHQLPQPTPTTAPPMASMPAQSSIRIHNEAQPVGHTGPTPTAPRASTHPHHPVQGATREPVREESQIVGSTAGAHVVMVTTDPQGHPGAGGMQSGERAANGFRQLKVEDALLYLEQVKSQFNEHPAVYNQFLDIMKEFKAQSINTSQVIRRVSQLFQGHKGLILGFNTFLPPGYKIELRDGGMTAGYSAPGEAFAALPSASTQAQPAQSLAQQPPPQPQSMPATVGIMQQHTANSHPAQPRTAHPAPYPQHQPHHAAIPHHMQHPQSRLPGPGRTQPDALHRQTMHGSTALAQHGAPMPLPAVPAPRAPGPADVQLGPRHQPLPTEGIKPTIAADGAATLAGGFGATGGPAPTEAGKPIEFDQAVSYVNKIKSRFSDDEAVYKRFLDILQTYQKEQRTIKQVYKQVSELFRDHPDLLNEFSHFLPEAQSVANAQAQQLAVQSAYMAGSSGKQQDGCEGADYMASHGKGGIMAYPSVAGGTGPHRGRPIKGENRLLGAGGLSGPSNLKKSTTSSDAGKKMRRSYKRSDDGYDHPPSIEMEFFEEVRNQLGESGAPVYKELIKCLSLVSQEIISAEELLKLIDGLLVDHKHLTNAFRMFINHTDPNAAERALQMVRKSKDPDHLSKRGRDEQRINPIYRDKKLSDVVREYGDSVPGSSYAKYPDDLGGVQCSGMTEKDREVLNCTVGIAKGGPRMLDHDSLHSSPDRHVSLEQVLQEGRKLRGPRVSDASDSSPRSPTAVLDDGPKVQQLTVEEQRVEMDVLIGSCDSTLRKLEQILAGEKTTDELTSHDLWPIELMYNDSFKEFEQLLRSSNEQAVRTVTARLQNRRKEWAEARNRMEQVWRTHRFGGDGRRRKYTRAEFVEEIKAVESRKESLFTGGECNAFVEELLWYMLEWNLDDDQVETAERVFNDFVRVRSVVQQTEGWFIAEEHLYTFLRLVCDVTERGQWVIEQGKAKETLDLLKGLLSNEIDIVVYEAKLGKLYGEKDWQERLCDFGLLLKKWVRAAMKLPERGLAQTMLGEAEQRVEKKDEMETDEGEEKYVKGALEMAEAKGCGMLFKMVCSARNGSAGRTEVEMKRVEKASDGVEGERRMSDNKFVNYVQRMARKRKRMEFESAEQSAVAQKA